MDLLKLLIGNYYGTDWLGMFFGCMCIYLLGSKSRWGFIAGIMANIAWFAFGILTSSIPDLIMQCIVVVMHVRGFLHWSRASKRKNLPTWLTASPRRQFPLPLI